MKFFHDEGVVLRKHDVGEKDEVVVMLTKAHGKMPFMAKGSRDPKSRKAGALQIFNTVAFEARQGKGKMPYLQQVKSLRSRSLAIVSSSENLDQFYRAAEMVKLSDSFLQEAQVATNVYVDVNGALDATSVPSSVLIYWIRLYQDLGFVPEWSSCCMCHEGLSLEEPMVFSVDNKGFAHQSCVSLPLPNVEPDVVKLMSFFQKAGLSDALRVEVPEKLSGLVKNFLEQIQEYSKH